MRSKAPLALMEQAVMVLVFALAAALCLRCFVWADQTSRRSAARDRAIVEAQSAAEALKATAGDFEAAAVSLGGSADGGSLMVDYGQDWTAAAEAVRYTLGAAAVDSGVPGLAKAEIWVHDLTQSEADCELFRIQVAWQTEVTGNG